QRRLVAEADAAGERGGEPGAEAVQQSVAGDGEACFAGDVWRLGSFQVDLHELHGGREDRRLLQLEDADLICGEGARDGEVDAVARRAPERDLPRVKLRRLHRCGDEGEARGNDARVRGEQPRARVEHGREDLFVEAEV